MSGLLALLAGCISPADTRDAPGETGTDTGAADPACTEAPAYGGSPAGTVACADGVCEVEAGDFWMGEANPLVPDACPARAVTLSAYAMDQTEVTAGRYDACVAAGACTPAAEHCRSDAADADALPVVCVDATQAATYCAWSGGRLPTEAEWEKAARGTDGARWPWGDSPPNCTRANYREVTTYCELGPVAVGSYPDAASPFGLLDVAGNVWEWVGDSYDAGYYRDAPAVDPPGPTVCSVEIGGDRGPCAWQVLRGGAYNTRQETVTAMARHGAPPTLSDVDVGFRCAYDR